MLVIGLTGGIGSGKSLVGDYFAELGVTVIDTDKIAREIAEPDQIAYEEIVDFFGLAILQANRQLDRKKLRDIIFNDSLKRKRLEEILHPRIRDEMARQIKSASSPYCIAMIPLLLETTPNPLINRILVVDAPEQLQRERTMHRDNESREAVQAIMDSQISRTKRLAAADDIIYNDGSPGDLRVQVDKLHKFYLDLSQKLI